MTRMLAMVILLVLSLHAIEQIPDPCGQMASAGTSFYLA